ncbi:hypothetical protein KFV11_09685 [Macrococcus equipercicus]|uniref:Protein kinase domain-containing protein n=1 Tax=Macrococcus equipercicus TaxID=69967 RepID=A0A9Q9BKX9_9STAP|nr:hypothetical protein KFV11_09685 [Macrococcus equipercicus]
MMEMINGTSISKTAVEHPETITAQLINAFLNQILVIGTYHADPHPGNIFIIHDGDIALIEFG